MIYVDRTRVPIPAVLSKPGRKGDIEQQAVAAFYADAGNRGKVFRNYTAYKHNEVKKALKDLFHNKCAYCEIDYGGAPWAVEHFRPKGAVQELDLATMARVKGSKPLGPGYYWLAAEWSNLLTACSDCNSPREQGFAGEGVERTAGKASFFPIEAGSARARAPNDGLLAGEHPLLLNPTVDEPSEHLGFGEGATIVELSARGRVTIGVFGLQRDDLVRKRQRERLLLLNLIASVKADLARLKKDRADTEAEKGLARNLEIIQLHYLADEAPFLAMNKQIVRENLGPVVVASVEPQVGLPRSTPSNRRPVQATAGQYGP